MRCNYCSTKYKKLEVVPLRKNVSINQGLRKGLEATTLNGRKIDVKWIDDKLDSFILCADCDAIRCSECTVIMMSGKKMKKEPICRWCSQVGGKKAEILEKMVDVCYNEVSE